MEQEIKSFVDIDLMDKFPSQYPDKSFFNYVSNLVGLEGFISVCGILAPDLIERDGHIFLKETYSMLNGNLRTRFGNDPKTIERYVNIFCVSDFYLLMSDTASHDDLLLYKLAEIIHTFWGMHLKKTFPNKQFDIELVKDGLFDEGGICITFSQR